MPQTVVLPDSGARPTGAASPTLRATMRDGGRDKAWVHLAGELDCASAPALESVLSEARRRAQLVVLDLRELTSIDSFGVRAIVDATTSARLDGRRLILVRGPSHVQRMFTLSASAHAVEIADVEPSFDEALAALAQEDRARRAARPAEPGARLRRVAAFMGAPRTTIGVKDAT